MVHQEIPAARGFRTRREHCATVLALGVARAVGIVLLSLVLNLAGNGRTGLWDRDEPRYAVCVREMRARGDWIFPTFNGEPRYHKPILIYWLMGLGTALGGDNPFGVRLVSAVAGAATVLGVWWLGRRMFGPRGGRLAALDLGDGADRDRRIEAGDDRRDPVALVARLPGVPLGARSTAVAHGGCAFLGFPEPGDPDQRPDRTGYDRGLVALGLVVGLADLGLETAALAVGTRRLRDRDGPLVYHDQPGLGGRVSRDSRSAGRSSTGLPPTWKRTAAFPAITRSSRPWSSIRGRPWCRPRSPVPGCAASPIRIWASCSAGRSGRSCCWSVSAPS